MNPAAETFYPEDVRVSQLLDQESYICMLQGQIVLLREIAGLPPVCFPSLASMGKFGKTSFKNGASDLEVDSRIAGASNRVDAQQGKRAVTDGRRRTGSGRDVGKSGGESLRDPADTQQYIQSDACNNKERVSYASVGAQCTQARTAGASVGVQCTQARTPGASVGVQCTQARTPSAASLTYLLQTFTAWRSASRYVRCTDTHASGRLLAGMRIRKADVARAVLRRWIGMLVTKSYKLCRIAYAFSRWKSGKLRTALAKIKEREIQMYEWEDDHHMTTERNKDLTLAIESLKFELQEQETRLANSRGTSAELLRRLKVSGECIKSMQKGFEIYCNKCRKTMLHMSETEDGTSLYSIQTSEECEDESQHKQILDFTHMHLMQATMAELTPMADVHF
ncbi:hypothetical protein CYMTET_47711 [Cymbomonas tetramitiformis]|uniref:Uncharacterized protein n=1 Tax=Cymbomonas tetramitiformis TaxID=36881 RepID=A0AAE0BTN3_9CHLO|nr:hypothetical protein CYMTET_47711 [Cymbomonas tetramitiformis]